ncbi:tripartite motif-containing protein 15-like [Neovison vison]|uniref:tripartite motif-containing protein 15-like n=1 Tax=Neovison vison TaxID=452646 RepID=UPI001CF0B815|nr:tripartite motif-containing protein 15-like [Neogale vison]
MPPACGGFHGGESQPCVGSRKETGNHRHWLRLPPPSRMGAQLSCQVLPCVPCKEKEPVQPLVVPVPLGPLGQMRCEEHGEEIYFFCETDAELLCVVCREGPSHRTHPVAVLDGAVQPYRDCLWSQSRALRLDKSEMEATWQREDRKLQKLLTHIESKKQQVDAAFGKLQRELADQHSLLQARLRELEVQTCLERDQYNSKFSEEITRLGAQAQELEEQSQQPASVLLQDVKADQSRYETRTFVSPETISPDLVKKIRDLHWKTLFLPEMLRAFSENLAHHLETDSGKQLGGWGFLLSSVQSVQSSSLHEVWSLTTGCSALASAGYETWQARPAPPDPRALSRSRALTEDRKPATFIRDEQDLPHGPLRSEGVPAALGTPRLLLKAPPQRAPRLRRPLARSVPGFGRRGNGLRSACVAGGGVQGALPRRPGGCLGTRAKLGSPRAFEKENKTPRRKLPELQEQSPRGSEAEPGEL